MRIHDVPNFPNPLRVRIALAEKNATNRVDFVPVDVMGGEHRTPEFLARNPAGGVPVLELEDGSHLAECSAITEYIDGIFEGIALTGTNVRERAEIHMQQRRAETMVLDAVATYFHHATDGLGEDLETYQNIEWGERQKDQALKGMVYFDDLLSTRDYIGGNEFSVADITLFAGLVFADFAGVEIPASLSHLSTWRQRINERPSVKSVLH